jgi:hypothetical protein
MRSARDTERIRHEAIVIEAILAAIIWRRSS